MLIIINHSDFATQNGHINVINFLVENGAHI